MRSGRWIGRAGAGFEPPSMDLSQLGYLLLWIQYDPHLSQVIPPCRLLRCYEEAGFNDVQFWSCWFNCSNGSFIGRVDVSEWCGQVEQQ
uniref:Uncharacterized protein n=1 Tax=Triticum urartu TaxID=4572 RepID=A0A8R7PJV2_TRIUA